MRPVFILLADYANTTPDQKLNVMGIFNSINAVSFPARHPTLFLVLKFVPELGDLDQTKKLAIKLEDADANPVMTFTVPFVIKRDDQGQRRDAGYILQLNDTVFPHPGNYEFVVYLDNEPVDRTPVNANLIDPDVTN